MTKDRGFTLVELLIAVAIVAVLAAIAIPQYKKFQFRAKRSEAYTNLKAIRICEETYASEHGGYLTEGWHPVGPPANPRKMKWNPPPWSNFVKLGFYPAGDVYFTYGIKKKDATSDMNVDPESGDSVPVRDRIVDITIIAASDLDGDHSWSFIGITDENVRLIGPQYDDF